MHWIDGISADPGHRKIRPDRAALIEKQAPIDLADSILLRLHGRIIDHLRSVMDQSKMYGRPGERGLLNDTADMG